MERPAALRERAPETFSPLGCYGLFRLRGHRTDALSAFLGGDEYPAIYLLRLAGFALIIFAILRKNLAR